MKSTSRPNPDSQLGKSFAIRSLGDLASAYPMSMSVFARHGLDFCCGGRASLKQACVEQGIDCRTVIKDVEVELARNEVQPRNWSSAPTADLLEHIVSHYHELHRRDLPEILKLARRVEGRHGDKPAYPSGLVQFLEHIRNELEQHMHKEECILFPLLMSGRMEQAQMPIQVMVAEHLAHGDNLEKLGQMLGDHPLPQDACNSWRLLFLRLEQLQMDLREHIHLENNELFPRAFVI